MFVEKLRKTLNKVIRIIITDKNGTDISFLIYQHLKLVTGSTSINLFPNLYRLFIRGVAMKEEF